MNKRDFIKLTALGSIGLALDHELIYASAIESFTLEVNPENPIEYSGVILREGKNFKSADMKTIGNQVLNLKLMYKNNLTDVGLVVPEIVLGYSKKMNDDPHTDTLIGMVTLWSGKLPYQGDSIKISPVVFSGTQHIAYYLLATINIRNSKVETVEKDGTSMVVHKDEWKHDKDSHDNLNRLYDRLSLNRKECSTTDNTDTLKFLKAEVNVLKHDREILQRFNPLFT